jgi:hypothetical protein
VAEVVLVRVRVSRAPVGSWPTAPEPGPWREKVTRAPAASVNRATFLELKISGGLSSLTMVPLTFPPTGSVLLWMLRKKVSSAS